jgi:hypothetical protein
MPITISGANFGATRGTSTVTFNGTAATPTTWSATGIVVPVPAGATTGNVVVTVGGLASNAVAFSVISVTLTASPGTVVAGSNVTVTWQGISAPSATDWVVLVPTGAADTNWVAWHYTTGTAGGSMSMTVPASVSPGTYDLRLLSNNSWQRLAVSNMLTVPAVTLTASPATVAPGATLTMTWQNIGAPSATDWLTLVPVGAADANWVAWIDTTGRASDSTLFTLPAGLSAGAYEVRLFANGGWKRLAVSNGVTVTAAGPSLTASPVATAPGGTLTAAWRNIAAATALDWVGVYAAGAADAGYVTRFYTGGRATDHTLATLPGSTSPGTYELRLFTNDTLTRLATSNSFTVAVGPSLSAKPVAVAAGGTLTVTWAGLATPTATDWVVLVPLNALDASWVAWSYTTGAASGSLSLAIPATVPSGTYELRLFAQNGWQRLALSNTVTVGPTVALTPTPVAPGGTVTVTWAGIGTPTPTDWLGFVPLNAPDTSFVAWVYTNGRAGDSLLLVLPPALPAGPYDLRLFANGGWQRLGASNVVTVTAPGPTLAVSPVTVAATSSLTVDWHGIGAPTATDWVGVYAVGAPDASYVTKAVTNGLASGTMTLGLPGGLAAGAYELRLFTNNTFTRLAVSNGLAVVAGPVVRITPATISAAGSRVLTVTFEGIAAPTPTDWVALVLLNGPDTGYVAWSYTTGAATGSLGLSVPATVAPGSYELRLFAHNTMQRLAVSTVVTITP